MIICSWKIRKWWTLWFKVRCGLPLVRVTELNGRIREPIMYRCRHGHKTYRCVIGPMCRCVVDPVLPDPNE